jgi:hypothetical protein
MAGTQGLLKVMGQMTGRDNRSPEVVAVVGVERTSRGEFAEKTPAT